MPDTSTMLRDTAVLTAALIGAALIWFDMTHALAVAAGSALGLLNYFLISRLVLRTIVGVSGPAQFASGLVLKSFIGLGLLFALLSILPGGAVMAGVSAVVTAISIRGIAGLFAVPVQEV